MEAQVKILLKILMSLSQVLFFTGCAGSTGNKPQPLYKQQKNVIQDRNSGLYYYAPRGATGGTIDKKTAYWHSIVSSGYLRCKENYAWVTYPEIYKKIESAGQAYARILTPADMKKLMKDLTYIPKRNSKEFKLIVKIETEATKSGNSMCLPPMSKNKLINTSHIKSNKLKSIMIQG